MRQSPRFLPCATLLWIVLLLARPIQGTISHPPVLEAQNGAMVQRRALCENATLDVQQYRIIEDACQQNPQNDFDVCSSQLNQYMNQSATETCATYYNTYMTCTNGHGQNATPCSGAQLDYALCFNHTLQAYAYCGCYYNLPDLLYECANVQLEIRPDTPQVSSAPAGSDLPKAPIPVDSVQSLISFLPYSASSDVASSTPVTTITAPSSPFQSTGIASTSVAPGALTLTGPPHPATTSVITTTGVTTITSCPALLSPCTAPYSSVLTYTTQYTTTLYNGPGQITTTSLSTVVVTRTSTITSCPPAVTDCPASLPATSTYTEAETRTILSCDGGCTGPTPAGGNDICVARRRKRAVVLG